MTQYHRLRVSALIDETHDSKSVVFEVPASLSTSFKYQAGQFLTLRLPIDGVYVPRCYSMSSSPELDEAPRVTVKRVRQGKGSNWICDHLKVGDELEVMPPSGIFTAKNLNKDFLLMAGGSGITPVFSILRHVLNHSSAHITILYANRDEKSVIFKDALNALANQVGGLQGAVGETGSFKKEMEALARLQRERQAAENTVTIKAAASNNAANQAALAAAKQRERMVQYPRAQQETNPVGASGVLSSKP